MTSTFTERSKKALERTGGPRVCFRCGKRLRVGDKVKPIRRSRITKVYHKACFEEMQN